MCMGTFSQNLSRCEAGTIMNEYQNLGIQQGYGSLSAACHGRHAAEERNVYYRNLKRFNKLIQSY